MKKAIVSAAIALGLAASASAETVTSTIDSASSVTLSAIIDASWLAAVGDQETPSLTNCVTAISVTTANSGNIGMSLGYSSTSTYGIRESGIYGVTLTAGTAKTSSNSTYYHLTESNSYYEGETATTAPSYVFTYTNSSGEEVTTDATTLTIANFITTVDWSTVQGVALTMVCTSSGTTAYLSYVDADGTVITYVGYDADLRYSGTTFESYSYDTSIASSVSVSTTAATASEAVAANITLLTASAVPEPATATLSLLALAGLAARRRRK